jgi:hypothetical protein
LGFDVLSFEASVEERLIEVKTTAYGAFAPFFATTNEVRVSRATDQRYHLYRAFDFRRQVRLFSKQGRPDASFHLEPANSLARIG